MAKMMNPPKKNRFPTEQPKKKKFRMPKFKFDFKKYKKLIIGITSGVLAGIFLICAAVMLFNYIFIDTPYDGVKFSKYMKVPTYFGRELKESDLNKVFEKQKKNLLLRYATFEPVTEGKIEEGYNVTIDAKGYIIKDGIRETEPFKNGKLTDYEVTDLGNHITAAGSTFSKEIQDAIKGKDANFKEVFTAQMTYDNDYSVEDMRGKTVEFDITIKKVTKTINPEYNDAFIFAKTDYKTVAEYEEATKKDIRNNLLWNTIIDETVMMKYPAKHIGIYTDEFDAYYSNYMVSQKITFEKLLSDVLGTTKEGFEAMRMQYAEGTVKEEMVLYFIIKTEKIRLSRDEYKEGALKIAKENDYKNIKELEQALGKEVVERTVIWEKVKTMVNESAVLIKD